MAEAPTRDQSPRLRQFARTPPGFVHMLQCGCGYLAPLPVVTLLRRYGELYPVEQALLRAVCSLCGKAGRAKVKTLRLCDPGCGKHRR